MFAGIPGKGAESGSRKDRGEDGSPNTANSREEGSRAAGYQSGLESGLEGVAAEIGHGAGERQAGEGNICGGRNGACEQMGSLALFPAVKNVRVPEFLELFQFNLTAAIRVQLLHECSRL